MSEEDIRELKRRIAEAEREIQRLKEEIEELRRLSAGYCLRRILRALFGEDVGSDELK